MREYAPKYGPPGTEPECVGSRNRRLRSPRSPSPQHHPSMAGNRPNYGPPGMEPDHVGSRNKGQRTVRAPIPRPQAIQKVPSEPETLQLPALPMSTKEPIPLIPFTNTPLKMPKPKQREAWKKTYAAQLATSNPDLLSHEVVDMTHEAWEQYEPALRQRLTTAAAERNAAKWRKKQIKLDPGFIGHRASRVTHLYNEVREKHPNLSWEDVMAQAKELEKREVIAWGQEEFIENKRVRKSAKMKRKKEAQEALRDRSRANQSQISNYFPKMERAQIEEDTGDETDYEPPESIERLQERSNAAAPSRKQQREQSARELLVVAEQERAHRKVARNQDAMRAKAARNEARMDETRRDEDRRNEKRAAEALRKEERNAEARRYKEARKAEADARKAEADLRRAEGEARRAEAQMAEAVRREKLYQAAVKHENMQRWLQQLAQEEPEAPEEMQIVSEEMEMEDEMWELDGMEDNDDEIQISG